MTQRHKKRIWFLLIVCAGQLAFTVAGVIWLSKRTERGLIDDLRRRQTADVRAILDRIADEIPRRRITDLTAAAPDLDRLQRMIERQRPPHEGVISVVRLESGEALLHPLADGQQAQFAPNALQGRVVGDYFYSAVRELPELGIALVAREPERNLREIGQRAARSFLVGGLVAAVLFVLFSAALTTALVQRYDRHVATVNTGLEGLVERRSRALVKTREAVIFGLAKLAEHRDDDTGAHLERIRSYVWILARELSGRCPELDQETIATLGTASSLHDIGKVGIPDAVLLKPGPLNADEREIIERHPLIGGDCLVAIKERLGEDDFLETACEITLAHHERWDGAGYPYGLSAEEIPLPARIVALADVYDALTSKRPYKNAMTHDESRVIIVNGSGSQFDPDVVAAFVATENQFRVIAEGPAALFAATPPAPTAETPAVAPV